MAPAKMSARKRRQQRRADDRDRAPLLEPKTERQAEYLASIKDNEQTFGIGPAGTGKTYVVSAYAADQMIVDPTLQLILCRPAVEAGGEKHGFLPGDIDEKMDPWVFPFFDVIKARLGSDAFKKALDCGRISVVPFTYMRGRTFANSIVLLDEAQNTTPKQMELFLGRIGEGSKVIINGDVRQKDIKGRSGLETAIQLAEAENIPVGVVRFTSGDIVRSGLAKMWVQAFEKHSELD